MPFCQKCGSQVEGKFCPACGSAVAGAGAPSSSSELPDNVAGALCYLLGVLTGIVFLILAPYKDKKNIRFHAFQSIFLFVALFIFNFAVGLIMPFSVGLFLGPVLMVAYLGIWIFMLWKTYQNEKIVLPVIGDLAEKQS